MVIVSLMTTKSYKIYLLTDLPAAIERIVDEFDMPVYMYTYDGEDGTELIVSDKEIDEDDLEDVAENLEEEDDD